MKTLVYIASGEYKKIYESLPFDHVYLVDRHSFKNQFEGKVQRYSSRSKVTLLSMDALEAIDFFRKNGIVIDCLVCINEGLMEGGGSYVINEDAFMGYAMTVLAQEYIHIMNPKYYLYRRTGDMDFPYFKEELYPGEAGYLDPAQFSDYHNVNHDYSRVFKMIHNPARNPWIDVLAKNRMAIIRDSAWNYYHELDRLFISIASPEITRFFLKKSRVRPIRAGDTYKSIVIRAMEDGMKHIGITPVKNGNFDELLRFLHKLTNKHRVKVYLFHMNYNDYKVQTDKVIAHSYLPPVLLDVNQN